MRKTEKPRPLFRRPQLLRLARLMDMMYTVSEIAEEFDSSIDTIYETYIPAGMPIEKQDHRYWINGKAFAEWVRQLVADRKQRHLEKMAENEAYCVKCNRPVKIENPKIKPIKKNLQMLHGQCGTCGRSVNRLQGLSAIGRPQ